MWSLQEIELLFKQEQEIGHKAYRIIEILQMVCKKN